MWGGIRDVPGLTKVRSGPIFLFPEDLGFPAKVLRVDSGNAPALTGPYADDDCLRRCRDSQMVQG